MNARHWLLVCMIGLVGCGDDDAVQPDAACLTDPIDAGDSGTDSGTDAGDSGLGTCDGPNARQITGFSLGGSCSTPSFLSGICAVGEGLTGHGQLYCFVHDQGGMIAAFLQHGEDTVGTAWRHSGSDTLGSQLSASEQALCDAAIAQLAEIPWHEDADAGTTAVSGVLIPYCTPY